MCPPPQAEEGGKGVVVNDNSPYPDNNKDQSSNLKKMVGGLAVTSVGLLIATIVLATNKNSGADCGGDAAIATTDSAPETAPEIPVDGDDSMATDEESFSFLNLKLSSSFYSDLEDNTCAGAKLQADNQPCVDLNVPQAGANVTKGYVGSLDMGDVVPNTKPYFQSSMCPVNVHWHLGTEHYSAGEYDENGSGPNGGTDLAEWAQRGLADDVRDGFRCNYYDENDEKFTKPYEWKYCVGMEVGETYEVHW